MGRILILQPVLIILFRPAGRVVFCTAAKKPPKNAWPTQFTLRVPLQHNLPIQVASIRLPGSYQLNRPSMADLPGQFMLFGKFLMGLMQLFIFSLATSFGQAKEVTCGEGCNI